jgi:hypothetical protein
MSVRQSRQSEAALFVGPAHPGFAAGYFRQTQGGTRHACAVGGVNATAEGGGRSGSGGLWLLSGERDQQARSKQEYDYNLQKVFGQLTGTAFLIPMAVSPL